MDTQTIVLAISFWGIIIVAVLRFLVCGSLGSTDDSTDDSHHSKYVDSLWDSSGAGIPGNIFTIDRDDDDDSSWSSAQRTESPFDFDD